VISGLSDAQAAIAETGRRQLEPLFNNSALTALTGIRGTTGTKPTNLVYCYAFNFGGAP
jgi:hypothetical protein